MVSLVVTNIEGHVLVVNISQSLINKMSTNICLGQNDNKYSPQFFLQNMYIEIFRKYWNTTIEVA